MDLFKDIIQSLSFTKNYLGNDEDLEKDYNPFIINKNFSYGIDTILLANEMNLKHSLPKKLQYDFYFNLIRAKKRFNKWGKKDNIDNLELLKEYFQINDKRAKEYLLLLSENDIELIKQKTFKGGVKK